MKRKIIALLCLMALCTNTVLATDIMPEPENDEILIKETIYEEDIVEDVEASVMEEIEPELEDIQEGGSEALIEIENNESSDIESEAEILSVPDKTELGKLLGWVENANPDDVAEEESLLAYQNAVKKAQSVYEDEAAEDTAISEAVQALKDAISALSYVVADSILTNNAFSDATLEEWYPEATGENPSLIIAQTSATYSYDSTTPDAFSGTDTQKSMLKDGTVASRQMTTGNGVKDDAILLYNLGDTYYVTGADVFSMFVYRGEEASKRYNMGSFTVAVSEDGTEYHEIAVATAKTEQDADESGTSNYAIVTNAEVVATPAKYVKITVECDEASSRYNFNEVVIKGFKSPFSREDLYEAIKACEGVDSFVYTTETYNAWKTAYDKAVAVYWDVDAAGKNIYAAKNALLEAYDALESKAITSNLLSGNVVSDFDKEYYGNWGRETLKNLSYTYTEDSNYQAKDNDASMNKMFNGNANSKETAHVSYGAWTDKDGSPVKILIDLGEECYITGVDVWAWLNSTSSRVDTVTISVPGADGEYIEVNKASNPLASGDGTKAEVIPQTLDPVKTRYLLLVADRGTSHQVVLGEIYLFGCRAGQASEDLFWVENMDYTNEAENRIISLDGNQTVTATGTVVSNIENDKDVVVVTAAYKNDDIVDYAYTQTTIRAYGSASFTNTLNLDGETGITLYTYVWDGLDTGLSLSKMKEFGSF